MLTKSIIIEVNPFLEEDKSLPSMKGNGKCLTKSAPAQAVLISVGLARGKCP